MVENLLTTWHCESVLNYTFHIHLFFRFYTKNVVIGKIFGISNTFIDRFHLSLFVKVSLSTTLFLYVKHKPQLVFVFGYMTFA